MKTGEIIFGIVNSLILIVTAYFIYRSIFSPVDAVTVGRELNSRQQKDNAKRNLFLILFSLRGSPLNYDFVKALNQIEVVFEDIETVLNAWHIHYNSLQNKGLVNPEKIWDMQRANLLSAMAVSLGYNRIRETDMLQNYYPVGHMNDLSQQEEHRNASLDYFLSGAALHKRVIQQMDANQSQTVEEKHC